MLPCATFAYFPLVVVPLSLLFHLPTLVSSPLSTLLSILTHVSTLDKENPVFPPLCFRSQQALCSLPAFPTLLHASTALNTFTQCVSDLGSHLWEVTRCTIECTTVSDHVYPKAPSSWLLPFLTLLHTCMALINWSRHVTWSGDHSHKVSWPVEACAIVEDLALSAPQPALSSLFPAYREDLGYHWLLVVVVPALLGLVCEGETPGWILTVPPLYCFCQYGLQLYKHCSAVLPFECLCNPGCKLLFVGKYAKLSDFGVKAVMSWPDISPTWAYSQVLLHNDSYLLGFQHVFW